MKSIGIASGIKIDSAWMQQAQDIRLQSEKEYGSSLIEARLLMITAFYDLLISKVGIPGRINENLGEILRLITVFWQGQFYTEKLISEGQYIQASAVIKQEIEIITRIIEIKQGIAREGKTPNVKYAPSMLNLHYGDMNNIAHLAKPYMLDTLTSIDRGSYRGVSIQPIFHAGISKNLYEIHLCVFYHILIEAIELFQHLYPDDPELVLPASKLIAFVTNVLAKCGFTLSNSTPEQSNC